MSIVTTRDQRRQLKRDNARMPTHLVEVPRDLWPEASRDGDTMLKVFRSRDFLCLVFAEPAPCVARLSINRTELTGTRWTDGITWDELQQVKAEAGYGLHAAVELYPPLNQVVNVANLRHLWVFPLGYVPSFMWVNGRAQA